MGPLLLSPFLLLPINSHCLVATLQIATLFYFLPLLYPSPRRGIRCNKEALHSVKLAGTNWCKLSQQSGHQFGATCSTNWCHLPINSQCILAIYITLQVREEESERGKVIPQNYEVFVR
jgi:hypothetical protein